MISYIIEQKICMGPGCSTYAIFLLRMEYLYLYSKEGKYKSSKKRRTKGSLTLRVTPPSGCDGEYGGGGWGGQGLGE